MKQLLTLLFILGTISLQAQKWHYGPTFSLSYAKAVGNGMSSKFSTGIQAGGFVRLEFNNKWSIQPELLYIDGNIKKGEDFLVYYNTDGRSNALTDMQLNYISIPLLVRYDINKYFAVMAGPQYSYLFHADENLERTGKEAFKKSAINAAIGGEFKLSGSVSIYARYNPGISNINNIDDRYKWKFTSVQIGTSVRIN